jgi:hypothetical protein
MATEPEPPSLRRETHSHDGPWALRHLAGLIALGIGAIGFLVVALSQRELWDTPDWRIALPFVIAAAIAAGVSIARREGAWAIPLVGVGLAASALVLGWFVITAIVVLATVVVIIILHSVM